MTDVVKRLEMLRDFVGRTTADTIDDAISEIVELRRQRDEAKSRAIEVLRSMRREVWGFDPSARDALIHAQERIEEGE